MPVDARVAGEVWSRYTFLRDNGHLDFVRKARRCEDFFAGLQWEKADLAALQAQRRPALTINKVISTISNVLGEQIFNRADVVFRPRNEGATSEVADALTKVFMQVSDNNHLAWVRSDVFCDGVVTSRGFFDVRLDFTDSLRGEVRITQLNPKHVMIDADADEYDPDTWSDVIVTRWMSPDQIELLYSKADADRLRHRGAAHADSMMGYDERDRFGGEAAWGDQSPTDEQAGVVRSIRVIERQWRKLDKVLHFVDLTTGDARPVPQGWSDEQVAEYLLRHPEQSTVKRLVQRIRWTVVADNVVLHDDWSPYKHFTVVPYFPYFRRGTTVGLVENLLGPQELLNKVSSQELHVVNTSANSGWITKRNALQNMSTAELEERGAQTGLVLEVDDIANVQKIAPNNTPQGLDRISYKAEEHIKSISGVSDYMQGFAREDVAAKSVVANQKSGQANLAKVMDNMTRTDHLLARAVLDIVQEYYTEQRLLYITSDRMTNDVEQLVVNEMTPEGRIVNDLSLGEYAVVVTQQPERDTFEDSQFDQAVRLRTEVGVQVPDKFILQASRLRDKGAIIQAMEGDQNSPEAQKQAELQQRTQEAQVQGLEADVQVKQADAQLRLAKVQSELASIGQDNGTSPDTEAMKLEADIQLQREKMEQEFALKREQMEREFALKRESLAQELQLKQQQHAQDMQLKQQQAAEDARRARIQEIHAAGQARRAEAQSRPNASGPSAKRSATAATRRDKGATE